MRNYTDKISSIHVRLVSVLKNSPAILRGKMRGLYQKLFPLCPPFVKGGWGDFDCRNGELRKESARHMGHGKRLMDEDFCLVIFCPLSAVR